MAIIRSLAVGKARKSAGNLTFRTVRGRTIVSEKVGERPVTRAPSAAQAQRAAYMTMISRYAKMHAGSIDVSFNKTKYGTSRNNFMKLNYNALVAAFESLAGSPEETANVSNAELEEAVTTYATENPDSIIRIYRSGYDTVYLNGAWESIEDPTPPLPPVGFYITTVGIDGVNQPVKDTAPSGSNIKEEGQSINIAGNELVKGSVYIITANNNTAAAYTEVSGDSIVSRTSTLITFNLCLLYTSPSPRDTR